MNPSTGRKTLLLTGAAGQLGTAIIELLVGQLDIIALTHRAGLRAATADAPAFDPDVAQFIVRPVRVLSCDLTVQDRIIDAVKAIAGLGVRVDYVINSAADSRFLGPVTDAVMLADDARRQFELNVLAPTIVCSALFHFQWKNIPVAEQRVSILNMSSLSGIQLYGDSGQGFYAASKAAINMLTMHMAAEYGRYGIKVNALAPNSFPKIVDTRVVASNALRILNTDVSGNIFKIGE
ncbi:MULTISPECIES: SDR family oxidoreductase [unclassified Bradyrhizobium]|uniref:SDR family NAD(P)-dependent oxidoreductase n=1 Tax=unclassified Bradyrhizobium TaxID=2631580 RepID=UPI0028E5192E|nr:MULTISPECIES: SDR family oxidoreductase [unclassified Bradyrhizobium]